MRNTTRWVALIGALTLVGCQGSEGNAEAQEGRTAQQREGQAGRQQRETQARQQRETGAQQQTGAQAGAQQRMQQAPRNLNAAQIAAVLELVNAAEIREARLAQERARGPEVRRFADQMLRDHTLAQDRHRALLQEQSITPREGEVTQRMQREGEAAMRQLRGQRGAAFDRAYIDAQVREHRDVVALLDANLTNVDERAYRDFLEEQRRTIDEHRQHAERIQTTLQPRASR